MPLSPKLIESLKKITEAQQVALARSAQRQAQKQDETAVDRLASALEGIGKINAYVGPKGDKGDTPVRGVDYFTNTDVALFLEAAKPVKGKDYRDGIDGKDGQDGKDGENGMDGIDGNANMEEVTGVIDESMSKHMKECNHALIHDSKMIGEYEVDTASLQEGDYLQVKGKKLVGVKIQMPDMGAVRGWVAQQGVSNIRHDTVTASRELEPFMRWIVDATAGDITLTIPSAQGREAQWFEIMRIDGTANTVTILPTGSETFSGMNSYILMQWTNFQIFGYKNNYLIRQAI